MNMQTPLLTKCCFCVPLRYGLLTWAYLRLILTIYFIGYTLLSLSVQFFFIFINVSSPDLFLILSPLILSFSDVIFDFLLIVGCHKKHTSLLRLYFWFGIAYALVFLFFSVTITTLILAAARKTYGNTSKVWRFITKFSSISGTVLILHVYLLMLVRSEISKLNQPSSQFQLPNHTADPSRVVKQADSLSINKKSHIV